jgi:hypothetical protein
MFFVFILGALMYCLPYYGREINYTKSSPSWGTNSPQVVQEFPAFYETVKFIALFTTVRYWSVSRDKFN